LTDAGAATYGELFNTVRAVAGRVFAAIDPVELATAKHVLDQIVERVGALRRELVA
jgi:hypothetical protein